MKKFNFITPVLFVVLLMMSAITATAQSKVDTRDAQGAKSMTSCHCFGHIDCWGFTGALGGNFSGQCKTDAHDAQCCDRVKAAYNNLSAGQKQIIADCLCSQGKPNGYALVVKKAVATDPYSYCATMATLVNTPAVTQTTCKCPSGWLANQTNVDGGITADGKCKKAVCGPISVPTPAGYTAVDGGWGFIGGNTLYAWGSAANGGAAICTTVVISPKVCKLQ